MLDIGYFDYICWKVCDQCVGTVAVMNKERHREQHEKWDR